MCVCTKRTRASSSLCWNPGTHTYTNIEANVDQSAICFQQVSLSNQCIAIALWTVPLRKVFDIKGDFSLYFSLTYINTHTHTVHNHSLKTFLKTLLLSERGFKELLFEFLMSGEKLCKFGNHNQETSKRLRHTQTHSVTQPTHPPTRLFLLRWDIISVHKQRFCLIFGLKIQTEHM